ncbi:MAG: hypothetical protein OK457_11590 [Thaumarchaeota archaeon]|nr:hypothetical protein [Nitrososphaerota archaeon]
MPEVSSSPTAPANSNHTGIFLKTLNEISDLTFAAEEDYRMSHVNLAFQIIEKRINSGEAGRSDLAAHWLIANDAIRGRRTKYLRRTKNLNPFLKAMETGDERKMRLQKSYNDARGTIYRMRSSELLPFIGRLRRELLLSEVLSSLPKKSLRDLYSITTAGPS